MEHLEFGPISAKATIAFFGLFHTSVAALAIGIAFIVTIAQVVGYRSNMRRYDLFAKRIQLFHVCIYNIGTINAIGLVFALSGLYPQFWEQLFTHFFWPLIVEEFLFLLLATTVTFHYFFWDRMWGHKKLHIFLGALLTPLFFLQMYMINGLGGFMLTPGQIPEGTLSQYVGILGHDTSIFYNPSFLMLQLHRTFANVSYAGFGVAGWCGVRLYLVTDAIKKKYYEDNGRLAFFIAFCSFLALPVIGYFFSHVLKTEANDAFINLMYGRGDIVKGGIDLWWLKHIFVAGMIGAGLGYFRKQRAKGIGAKRFSVGSAFVYAVAGFYFVFYLAMGMIMTWLFFFLTLGFAVVAFLIATHMINHSKGSGRAAFILMGLLAFGTVMLGGYAREASRPRFVNRISHYDDIYVPEERQKYLLVDVKPGEIPEAPPQDRGVDAVQLISKKCTGCHGLDKLRIYRGDDWARVVNLMVVYGTRLNDEEQTLIVKHLESGEPY
jgi:cytochrome bd-type quinol oxidase subunit 1